MIINTIAGRINDLICYCYANNISFTQIILALIVINVSCYILKRIITVIGEVKML